MVDRQALMHQLVDYLQATPTLPSYLGSAPTAEEAGIAFDPYQMVSEWIALRQEMKQQGKLLQTAQEQGQRELEQLRSQNATLQQQWAEAQQQAAADWGATLADREKQWEKEQERWFKGLLSVLDALDQACAHWEQQSEPIATPTIAPPPHWRTRLAHWLLSFDSPAPQSSSPADSSDSVANGDSDRQGMILIRQNLLDRLQQQQVVPLLALGQPFDPQCMYAIGRQPSPAPAQTVIQEATRGYVWRDRILREAQVIVSAGELS
jgi:molecular chaperone GrpE